MDPFATSHFSHLALLQEFDALVARDHDSFAVLLTRIAEIDPQRKLYLDEGYPSMKAFLVHRMHLPTENSAYKRLTAARIVRKYPGVLVALSEGRLHLTAVLMLGPRRTSANADALVAAAQDKNCFELQVMLAERFPRPDLPARLDAIAQPTAPLTPATSTNSLAAKRVEATIPDQPVNAEERRISELASQRVEGPPPRVVPLAPQRFGFQCTVDRETHELWQQARALMSHEVPSGEMALVLKNVLKLAVQQLEKRKFAATDRPAPSRSSTDPRHIPAAVKRAVRERDGGQCSFVSEAGQRCTARSFLEYDHLVPVAIGGESTVENLRLLCRAHNRHAAGRAFGAEFMDDKKREARACRSAARWSGHVADAASGEPL